MRDKNNFTTLHYAVVGGNRQTLNIIWDAIRNISKNDDFLREALFKPSLTPLHLAVDH